MSTVVGFPLGTAMVSQALLPPTQTCLRHWAGQANFGFQDSPFQPALVASMDGGGDNGSLNIFLGNLSGREYAVHHVDTLPPIYLGGLWRLWEDMFMNYRARANNFTWPADLMSPAVYGTATVQGVNRLKRLLFNHRMRFDVVVVVGSLQSRCEAEKKTSSDDHEASAWYLLVLVFVAVGDTRSPRVPLPQPRFSVLFTIDM